MHQIALQGPVLLSRLRQRHDEVEAHYRQGSGGCEVGLEKALARERQLVDMMCELDQLAQEENDSSIETDERMKAREEKEVAEKQLSRLQAEEEYLVQVQDVMRIISSGKSTLKFMECAANKRIEQFMELDNYIREAGQEVGRKIKAELIPRYRVGLETSGWPPVWGKEVKVSDEVRQISGELIKCQALAVALYDMEAELGKGLWIVDGLMSGVIERAMFLFEGKRAVGGLLELVDWCLRIVRESREALGVLGEALGDSLPDFRKIPEPLLVLLVRDLLGLLRRRVRREWEEEGQMGKCVEVCVGLDRVLDEEFGYHAASILAMSGAKEKGGSECGDWRDRTIGRALRGVRWWRAVEVITEVRERLEMWGRADSEWVVGSLDAVCQREGAWEVRGTEGGMLWPTVAVQGLACLLRTLAERYGVVKDVQALRYLCECTYMPLLGLYEEWIYRKAKACRIGPGVHSGEWSEILGKYCGVITSTQLAIEALEELGSEAVMLRLEVRRKEGADRGEGGKRGSFGDVLGKLGEEGVRVAAKGSDGVSRVVEESGTIIGPTRLLRKVMGLGRDMVSTSTPRRERGGGEGCQMQGSEDSSTLQNGIENGLAGKQAAEEAEEEKVERSSSCLDGALQMLSDAKSREWIHQETHTSHDTHADPQSASPPSLSSPSPFLSTHLLHLTTYRDGMLDDLLDAIIAGFHYQASTYLATLPPPPLLPLSPSPTFLPALAFLDTLFSTAAHTLEATALLCLGQRILISLRSTLLKCLRGCRAVGQREGEQLMLDLGALRAVCASAGVGLEPEVYLREVGEIVAMLSWDARKVEGLGSFLQGLMGETGEGLENAGVREEVSLALGAKGLRVLEVGDVMYWLKVRRTGIREQRL